MKIHFIATSILPSNSANSINVVKVADSFFEIGHDVTLSFFSNQNNNVNEIKEYYGVINNVKYVGYRYSKLYYIFVLLKSLFNKPDIIYTRHSDVAYYASKMGLKTILHIHSLPTKKNRMNRILKLINNKSCLRVCVASNGLKDILLNSHGKNTDKVVMISNGVDLDKYLVSQSKEDIRKELGIKLIEKLIVYTGSLMEGRGIDKIIEISKHLPEHTFYIIGGTLEEIEKYSSVVENDNINFLGHIPNSKIYKYLIAADYLLMPYQEKVKIHGGYNTGDTIRPLKLFEYIASTNPIITSDLKGIRDVLTDDECVFVSATSVDSWVDAIRNLDNNSELVTEIRKNLSVKRLQFSNENIVQKILEGVSIK